MSVRLVITDLEPTKAHLYAVARAYQDETLICFERLALDRVEARRAFAAEVEKIRPGTDTTAIDAELLRFVDETMRPGGDDGEAELGSALRSGGGKQSTDLVKLADDCELFHDTGADAFITFPVDDHRETWPLKARAVKDFLSRRYFVERRTVPNSQALGDALATLRGKALFEGPERPVYARVAELGGAIYLDLTNSAWQVVEITAGAWRVISDPPVKFRRTRGMRPLLLPVPGGSLEQLRRFLNISDADWRLLLSWLVMAFRPIGPYPILLLHGEQGSAKSTAARVLRALVDPNVAPLRSKPRDEVDLLIAANNGWIVALDNLSYLSDDLSDAVGRLATGGGIGKRELYSDADEVLLDAMRPIILNGIEALATRGDVVDRGMTIYLPRIPKDRRLGETRFWREFELARPMILGALLDVVAAALRAEPDVRLSGSPRMADFAIWSAAAATALGWSAEEFLAAYEANRRESNELPLQSSVLTEWLVALVNDYGSWEGTASDLLDALKDRADERALKDKRWPRDAARLSGALRRLAPSLLGIGIQVEFLRSGERRRIRITREDSPPDGAGEPSIEVSRNGASPASPASRVTRDQEARAGAPGDAEGSDSVTAIVQSVIVAAPDVPLGYDRDAADRRDDAAAELSVTAPPDASDAHDAHDAEMRASAENVVLVTEADQLEDALPDLLDAPVLGFDIETTGLDPRSHRMRLAQLAVPGGRVYVVDLFRVDPRSLARVLDGGRRLVGHNLKFDLAFLAAAGLSVPNGDRLVDTMLAAQLLGAGTAEGRLDQCGLAAVVERFLGRSVDKAEQKSDWTGPLSEDRSRTPRERPDSAVTGGDAGTAT